jgi:HSP20 family protein
MTTERKEPDTSRSLERAPAGILRWPEAERLLHPFFSRTPFWRFLGRPERLWPSEEAWLPDTDIIERPDEIVVRADLPGVRKEDIEITVQDGTLAIRGHREESKETKEESYYSIERASGSFYRSIVLPQGVDSKSISATYRDGVLEVSIPRPKAPEAEKVKVEVKG